MDRSYLNIVQDHFAHNAQMALLSGPRQVGKTTISKQLADTMEYSKYLNWDITKDRQIILSDTDELTSGLPIQAIMNNRPLIIFDEIHKYKDWKNYLKGIFDEFNTQLNIVVTGSAKLNVVRRGGDSLMGRYFLYRVHPLSVREMCSTIIQPSAISTPIKIDNDKFDALFQFGGFPEPLAKQSQKFYIQWHTLREEQMLNEDIGSAEKIQDVALLQVLAELLKHQVGGQVKYSELAKKIRVADTTIRRWVTILESYYYCFLIKPYSTNISRSIIKEPKAYLWDWSLVQDEGAKIENFVASHLHKAVHYWRDIGLGKYELFYLRDKDKKEVDFLITENKKPWILIEVKKSVKAPLSENLKYFQDQTNAPYAFQLAFDMPYVDIDCFSVHRPMIVSARSFLSQLV